MGKRGPQPRPAASRRRGRPPTFTPEEAAARDRQQKHDSYIRNRADANTRRNARRARLREIEKRIGPDLAEIDASSSVVTALHLRRPNLLYIDATGEIHQEKWESADELIQRWLHAQARARKLCEETEGLLEKATKIFNAHRKEKNT